LWFDCGWHWTTYHSTAVKNSAEVSHKSVYFHWWCEVLYKSEKNSWNVAKITKNSVIY
jgi:hypothetical protein